MSNYVIENSFISFLIISSVCFLIALIISIIANSSLKNNDSEDNKNKHGLSNYILAFLLAYVPFFLFGMLILGIITAYGWEKAPIKKETVLAYSQNEVSTSSLKNIETSVPYKKGQIFYFKKIGQQTREVLMIEDHKKPKN